MRSMNGMAETREGRPVTSRVAHQIPAEGPAGRGSPVGVPLFNHESAVLAASAEREMTLRSSPD